MLPRAALRLRASQTHPSFLRQHAVASSVASILQTRAYAKAGRPPPPPPHSAKPTRRPPPPPQQYQAAASGSVRQTSPGTALPKDKTWKPKDSINFGGPDASTPSGLAAAAGAGTAAASSATGTPIGGTRSEDSTAKQSASPLAEDNAAQEPVAQRQDLDQPPTGSAREAAQENEAISENTPPPPEAFAEEVAKDEQAPQQTGPLPDLRQGIPSTFDLEFGSAKMKMDRETASTEKPSEQTENDGIDLTSVRDGPEEQRERSERQYKRSDYETSLDRRRARVANILYATMAFMALSGCAYLARPLRATEEIPSGLDPEDVDGWSPLKMWSRVRARFRSQADYYTEPTSTKLLPDVPPEARPQSGMTLVLSLEDLMIHSTWDREHGYRVAKRPGLDYFIRYLTPYFELVLFTAAPSMMADPVIRKLDPYHFIQFPLFREQTKYSGGKYIKDLSYLNRDLKKTVIIDTNATHVQNQPENAILLPKWTGDQKDPHSRDLVALIPFLENLAMSGAQDVREVIKGFEGQDIATEFAAREAKAREKFLAQQASTRPRRSGLSALAGGFGLGSNSGLVSAVDGKPLESYSEAVAKGKMWSDQIREQGQRQYEALEKQIRETGEDFLKGEEEREKKFLEEQSAEMKKSTFTWFRGNN